MVNPQQSQQCPPYTNNLAVAFLHSHLSTRPRLAGYTLLHCRSSHSELINSRPRRILGSGYNGQWLDASSALRRHCTTPLHDPTATTTALCRGVGERAVFLPIIDLIG